MRFTRLRGIFSGSLNSFQQKFFSYFLLDSFGPRTHVINTKNRFSQLNSLFVILTALVLTACSGNSSDALSPSSPSPESVPIGASSERILNEQQPSVTLDGTATVIFSKADASGSPIVKVIKQKSITSSEIFSKIQSKLEIENGLDYEVAVTTSILPVELTEIVVSVPSALSIIANHKKALMSYYEVPADGDQEAGYLPADSVSDLSKKTVSTDIPNWAWQDLGNGSFQIILKLGIAASYSDGSEILPPFLEKVAPPKGSEVISFIQPDILCPLHKDHGCIETSMRSLSRTISENGVPITRPHNGMDLRADFVDVYSSIEGYVTRADDANGVLEMQDTKPPMPPTLKLIYRHLNFIWVNKDVPVNAGELVAQSGDKLTKDKHLHLEMLIPKTRSCSVNHEGENFICQLVLDFVDPFQYMLRNVQITRISPQGSMPVDVAVGDTIRLAMKGYDRDGTEVSSEVTATTPGNNDRRIVWTSSDESAVTIAPLHAPPFRTNPSKFNQADVRINLDILTAVYAYWGSEITDQTISSVFGEYILSEDDPVAALYIFQTPGSPMNGVNIFTPVRVITTGTSAYTSSLAPSQSEPFTVSQVEVMAVFDESFKRLYNPALCKLGDRWIPHRYQARHLEHYPPLEGYTGPGQDRSWDGSLELNENGDMTVTFQQLDTFDVTFVVNPDHLPGRVIQRFTGRYETSKKYVTNLNLGGGSYFSVSDSVSRVDSTYSDPIPSGWSQTVADSSGTASWKPEEASPPSLPGVNLRKVREFVAGETLPDECVAPSASDPLILR